MRSKNPSYDLKSTSLSKQILKNTRQKFNLAFGLTSTFKKKIIISNKLYLNNNNNSYSSSKLDKKINLKLKYLKKE